MISGQIFKPGDPLPDNLPEDRLQDCLKRGLIIEVKTGKAPPKAKVQISKAWRASHQPVSKWALNPADLAGKTLKQLNIMILEKDQSMEPFDTLDQAVEALSKDFKSK